MSSGKLIFGALTVILSMYEAHSAQKPLTTSEREACTQASLEGFSEWKQYPAAKLNDQHHPHSFELPIALYVYNHSRWFERMSENDLEYDLENAREVFAKCDIQVVVKEVKFYSGPKFLGKLDHPLDNHNALTDRERCLMAPIHRDGLVNAYYVSSVSSDKTLGTAHALSRKAFGHEYAGSDPQDRRFIGAVVIPDGARVRAPRVVFAHEIGHVVFDEGHDYGRDSNIMSGREDSLALKVTEHQCQRAKRSPFVKKIK